MPQDAFGQSAGVGPTGGVRPAGDSGASELPPGASIAGRYEVRARIGAGGMGAVYRVHDRLRSRQVALKVILPSLLASPKAAERFAQEAEVMLGLTHEGIVRVFDVGEDAERGLRFYTMELLEGETLRAWLERKRAAGEQVDPAEALEIGRQLLDALRYAHAKTVHRDLKPENVFVLPGPRVRILDFGIAKLKAAGGLTATSSAMGTPYYMAPEQARDAAKVDQRADIYSVCVILYEMLTGKLPIGQFKTPSEERPALPRGIDDIVARGLAYEPERRPDTAERLLAEIAALRAEVKRAAGGPAAAAPARATAPIAASQAPAGRPLAPAAAALAAVLALCAAGVWWASRPAPPGPAPVRPEPAPARPEPSPAPERGAGEAIRATEPKLTIDGPGDGAWLRDPSVEVFGRVEAAHPGWVVVAGERTDVAPDGAFRAPVTLREGENPIAVEAFDREGAASEPARLVLHLDARPPAVALEPVAVQPGGREAVVRGTVDEDGCRVRVENAPAEMIGRRFEARTPLVPGMDIIRVIATDRAGNEGRAAARVP